MVKERMVVVGLEFTYHPCHASTQTSRPKADKNGWNEISLLFRLRSHDWTIFLGFFLEIATEGYKRRLFFDLAVENRTKNHQDTMKF